MIVLNCSRVLDGKGGILENACVVVKGSKIVAVTSGSEETPSTYNLTGLTLMPGWIDTHAHISWHFDQNNRLAGEVLPSGHFCFRADETFETPEQTLAYAAENAYATLMDGFTTVQSPGDLIDVKLREAIENKSLPGPRILTSVGWVLGKDGSADQLRAVVRRYVEQGADFIKVFTSGSIRDGGLTSMTQDQIDAVIDEANALDRRVLVHSHSSKGAEGTILAGPKKMALEHGVMVSKDVFALMAKRGVYYDPTIAVIHNYDKNRKSYIGIPNYTEEGIDMMLTQALPRALENLL